MLFYDNEFVIFSYDFSSNDFHLLSNYDTTFPHRFINPLIISLMSVVFFNHLMSQKNWENCDKQKSK